MCLLCDGCSWNTLYHCRHSCVTEKQFVCFCEYWTLCVLYLMQSVQFGAVKPLVVSCFPAISIRIKVFPSESSGPPRPESCSSPYSDSLTVSLPSVCSHLISAHTLCLSLPSPRWWDAVCKGHARAHRHTVNCTALPAMLSWLSIIVRGQRSPTPALLSHFPPVVLYRINVQLLSISPNYIPSLAEVCVRVCVCVHRRLQC